MALAHQEEEDYGERFVDFWTSRQPNCSDSEQGQKGSCDFPVWDYPSPAMDKRCNHDLLDEQKDLLLEDYPCDHVHNKVSMQFPEHTWTPSYPEDVFSQDYLLAAQKLSSRTGAQAQEAEERRANLSGPQGTHREDSNCSSDCHVLVKTICNLSKLLLSHYSSPPSASARELQLALFNLSRCLVRAHGTEGEKAEASGGAAASANKCRSPENDARASGSSAVDEAEDDIVARLQVLMGLEDDRRAHEESDELCMDQSKSTKQQEAGSYLDLNQVEQRLAMLGSRPALPTEDGAGIISGEQIDEEYIRQNADQAINPTEGNLEDPAAPAAAAAAASVEKVLRSDSSEESWEHVS